ncbi:MAG: hypothetical protein ACRDE7_13535 [Sphingobacterium sp.]
MNTGRKAYKELIEIDIDTGLPTGQKKPNVPSDPDYIPPFGDAELCPIIDEVIWKGKEETAYCEQIENTTTSTTTSTTTTTTSTTTSTTTTTTIPYTTYYYTGRYREDDSVHVPPGGTIRWIDQYGVAQEIIGLIKGDCVIVTASKITYQLGVMQTTECK